MRYVDAWPPVVLTFGPLTKDAYGHLKAKAIARTPLSGGQEQKTWSCWGVTQKSDTQDDAPFSQKEYSGTKTREGGLLLFT